MVDDLSIALKDDMIHGVQTDGWRDALLITPIPAYWRCATSFCKEGLYWRYYYLPVVRVKMVIHLRWLRLLLTVPNL